MSKHPYYERKLRAVEAERDKAQIEKQYWAQHYDQCCLDIAKLLSERDEARREIERLTERLDAKADVMDRLEAERDEARALLTHAGLVDAQAQHNTLRAERDRLRALLRQIRVSASHCPICGGVWQMSDDSRGLLVDPLTGEPVTLGCTIGCKFDAALEGRDA